MLHREPVRTGHGGLEWARIRAPVRWAEPTEVSGRIYSRLLGHNLHPEVVSVFRERFAKAVFVRLEEPTHAARQQAEQMRVEAAAADFSVTVGRQPWNWLLLYEVANFLIFRLRDPLTGLELARAGLALNPACSAELWNAYGDVLFAVGRIEHSHRAYERCLAVNLDDVLAHYYNLSFVHLHCRDHTAALQVIAEGLGRGRRGIYRDRLLRKQAEVLADAARRAQ